MAKDLLQKNRIEFMEISLDYDESARKLLKELGLNTVPQIFDEEQHIGGYNDLKLKLTENI
tara:strand:+ start:244 stop:426 length:183 start_codon:yes stop_codon:yes gene_type:complete